MTIYIYPSIFFISWFLMKGINICTVPRTEHPSKIDEKTEIVDCCELWAYEALWEYFVTMSTIQKHMWKIDKCIWLKKKKNGHEAESNIEGAVGISGRYRLAFSAYDSNSHLIHMPGLWGRATRLILQSTMLILSVACFIDLFFFFPKCLHDHLEHYFE